MKITDEKIKRFYEKFDEPEASERKELLLKESTNSIQRCITCKYLDYYERCYEHIFYVRHNEAINHTCTKHVYDSGLE